MNNSKKQLMNNSKEMTHKNKHRSDFMVLLLENSPHNIAMMTVVQFGFILIYLKNSNSHRIGMTV